MAGPLIAVLEVKRALDCLNPRKGTDPNTFFPEILKGLSSHIDPVLTRMFKLSHQTAQVRGIRLMPRNGNPYRKTSHTTEPRQFRPICVTPVIRKALETILKEKLQSRLSQISLLQRNNVASSLVDRL